MDCTTRKQGKKSKRAKKQGRQIQKKKTDSYREILLPQREGTSSAMFGLDAHQTQLFLEFFSMHSH
jgi:hypothetical protein